MNEFNVTYEIIMTKEIINGTKFLSQNFLTRGLLNFHFLDSLFVLIWTIVVKVHGLYRTQWWPVWYLLCSTYYNAIITTSYLNNFDKTMFNTFSGGNSALLFTIIRVYYKRVLSCEITIFRSHLCYITLLSLISN